MACQPGAGCSWEQGVGEGPGVLVLPEVAEASSPAQPAACWELDVLRHLVPGTLRTRLDSENTAAGSWTCFPAVTLLTESPVPERPQCVRAPTRGCRAFWGRGCSGELRVNGNPVLTPW